jgi:hypothetical protein
MAYGGKATQKKKRADVAKQAQVILSAVHSVHAHPPPLTLHVARCQDGHYPLTGEVQVKEVTGGGGWRLVVKKITQREATRKVAKRKGKEHTSARYDMGPWETEREALAASTTFRNWVEFGQARHPGPPQNANRKRSHGAAAAAAADPLTPSQSLGRRAAASTRDQGTQPSASAHSRPPGPPSSLACAGRLDLEAAPLPQQWPRLALPVCAGQQAQREATTLGCPTRSQ